MPTVHVQLPGSPYEVRVEPDLLRVAGAAIRALGGEPKLAVVSDETVHGHHGDALVASLRTAGFESSVHLVPAGEASKCFDRVASLCEGLADAGHDRDSMVVALGGGVVGDLAGFVAASFYRGIPCVQVPTTIVAQVDSSVGGKTGINLPQGKNLVGAFHQPRLVLVDPETLRTLPPREYREGFAEVIKHAAIRDAAMLDELAALDPVGPAPPADLIARNLAIKARIVEADVLETAGTRALLNFGHTIGHGIEAAVPYGQLLHGEAIALGLRAALFLSERHGGLEPRDAARILGLLEHFGLPTRLDPEIATETVLERMSRDKKFRAGRIRFVLLRAPGDAFLSETVTAADLEDAVDHLRS